MISNLNNHKQGSRYMVPQDIEQLHQWFTEIENLTSRPVIRAKCQEAKMYIKLLHGATLDAPEVLG